MVRGITAAGLALVCAACTSVGPAVPTSSACAVGEAMIETQLYFGQSIPGGGAVKPAQWDAFVAKEVAPRFPEGFTVHDAGGFWLDGTTKRTISERSKVIVRLHPPGPAADAALDSIAAAYKTAFGQESVLRVDKPVCARF